MEYLWLLLPLAILSVIAGYCHYHDERKEVQNRVNRDVVDDRWN